MDHSDDKADPHQGDAGSSSADLNASAEPTGNGTGPAEDSASGSDDAASPSSAATQPTGSNLSALDSGFSDLTPFFPRAEASGATGPGRGRFASQLDFASNAALVVCVLGFAFAAGTYFFGGGPGGPKAVTAAATQQDAERTEMLQTTQKIVADMSALKANVEALRASLAQEQAANDPAGIRERASTR